VLPGLVFGAVLLASAVANARQRRATHR
jgi:hypothetical protein